VPPQVTLRQLLQYVLAGRPGVAIPDAAWIAAAQALADARTRLPPLPGQNQGASETARQWFGWRHAVWCPRPDAASGGAASDALSALAFAHKRLLLPDKVLVDTVRPETGDRWRLRSARPRGCACCAPLDDEAGKARSGQREESRAMDLAVPGAFAGGNIRRRKPAKV